MNQTAQGLGIMPSLIGGMIACLCVGRCPLGGPAAWLAGVGLQQRLDPLPVLRFYDRCMRALMDLVIVADHSGIDRIGEEGLDLAKAHQAAASTADRTSRKIVPSLSPSGVNFSRHRVGHLRQSETGSSWSDSTPVRALLGNAAYSEFT